MNNDYFLRLFHGNAIPLRPDEWLFLSLGVVAALPLIYVLFMIAKKWGRAL